MKILKDFKNDLLNRREIDTIIQAEKTPSYAEISKKLSDHFKSQEENIVINRVKGAFGSRNFSVLASIYESKEAKDKIEPKPKEKKKIEPEGEKK